MILSLTTVEIANVKLRLMVHQIAHRYSNGERNLVLRVSFVKTVDVEVTVLLSIVEGF